MESVPLGFLVAVVAVLALGFGIAIDRYLLRRFRLNRLANARAEANKIISDAEQEIETKTQKRLVEVESEFFARRDELKKELTNSRKHLKRTRNKLDQRQEKLNKRTRRVNERENVLHKASDAIEAMRSEAEQSRQMGSNLHSQATALLEYAQTQKKNIEEKQSLLDSERVHLKATRNRLSQLVDEQVRKLERVAGLSQVDARKALLNQLTEEAKLEAAARVKEIRDEAKLKAGREAQKIVLTTIQRTAASHTIENTVSVVHLASDDMKGRIIGREGRNIRAFESLTGIEVIVDDTPEAVILSGFDPIRREIARIALTRLLHDGRIHPARIEEVVAKANSEIEDEIVEVGERAVIDLNLHGVHPELVRMIGRMRYRTSYGQNLLAHSIETARIASIMAAEIGLDATAARRAGLLHDIGKVSEHPIESPHALVGMDLCRKYMESTEICNAVGAHHDEIEMQSSIAPLIQSADAVSGARPGARREALEAYVKRLEKLEDLARSFNGVERVYALQAGREIRVIVNHNLVSDAHAEQLADDVSKKIQSDLQYPGQIKVTVIREVRSISYAK